MLTNTDVRLADMDPLWHYVSIGIQEGRNPSNEFDSEFYLSTNKDVEQAGIPPIIHYIKHGFRENRLIKEQDKEIPEIIQPEQPNNIPESPPQNLISNEPEIILNNKEEDDLYKKVYVTYLNNALSSKDDNYVAFCENNILNTEDIIKFIAFYLPQYHPIPENDEWWGKGFTEWRNVAKAIPHFLGHNQPQIPGELGYYDLRIPEVLRRQVQLAKNYGIYGFCFHYYWFARRRLLEKPLEIFINDPGIDFPFCVSWANENWTRKWDGNDQEILIEQEQSFQNDKRIIEDLAGLFQNPNYIKINDRPLFIVYRANLLLDISRTIDFWREYSIKSGVGNPYIIAAQTFTYSDPRADGFDGAVEFPPHNVEVSPCINEGVNFLNDRFSGYVFKYQDLAKAFGGSNLNAPYPQFKTNNPGWDNSPRRLENALIFTDQSTETYKNWLYEISAYTYMRFPKEERLVFINAWNEWAESAHLEPDTKFGYGYLQKTYEVLEKINDLSKDKNNSLQLDLNDSSRISNQYENKFNNIIAKWPNISGQLSTGKIELLTLAIDDMFSAPEKEENTNIDASIIIPVYNHLQDTVNCLKSLAACNDKSTFEVIIVDDGSTDHTESLFSRCKHIKYLRNKENLGFLSACNKAAESAGGEFIVLLNNDAVALPGWLDALVDTFTDHPQAGLVGAKLVYPNGTMQEAGGIVFRDGSAFNFGRDDDPKKPAFNYLREADYCSGACICVPKSLWIELNGFDTFFSPAYYEDTDFAFRVREAGYQVLFQPSSEIIHYEGKTSGMDVTKGIKRYQIINQEKFFQRWESVLKNHEENLSEPMLCRNHQRQNHVLVVDVCTPKPDQDSGSVDTYNYLVTLRKLGFEVTFISDVDAHVIDKYVINLLNQGIECIYQPYLQSIEAYIKTNGKYFEYVFLFRAPYGGKYIDLVKAHAPHAKVVFNTVDLHFLRERREKELFANRKGKKLNQEGVTEVKELSIMKKADHSIVVSSFEYDLLKKLDKTISVKVIPLPREIPGRSKGFDERKDFVFIGGFLHKPNADAVKYFINDIWPIIREKLPDCKFLIVGSNMPEEIQAFECDSIKVLGFVPDLNDVFSNCRLSVAPLRYGAGIKGKVVTSLSYGVPCISTSLGVEGMGLTEFENILIGDTPEKFADRLISLYTEKPLWEKLSSNGVTFMQENFSLSIFEENLQNLINAKKK